MACNWVMQEFVAVSRDESATWHDPSLSNSDLKPGLYIVMFIFRSFSVADLMWITIQLHVSLWLKVVKLWPMLNILRQAVAQSYSLITLCLLLSYYCKLHIYADQCETWFFLHVAGTLAHRINSDDATWYIDESKDDGRCKRTAK